MARKPIERPRTTLVPLPCRWYAPGKFAHNPNWELHTLCEGYFLAEIAQDGPNYFVFVPGAKVPELSFSTAHAAKEWAEGFLADPSNFK